VGALATTSANHRGRPCEAVTAKLSWRVQNRHGPSCLVVGVLVGVVLWLGAIRDVRSALFVMLSFPTLTASLTVALRR
jgi:hypothetical protein